MQCPGCIWAHLDPRADLAQGVGLFVHVHVETGAEQEQGNPKATDTTTDNCHFRNHIHLK